VKFLYPLKVFKYARIFRKEHVGVLVTNLSADMKTASVAARLAVRTHDHLPKRQCHSGVEHPHQPLHFQADIDQDYRQFTGNQAHHSG
jgi:hypothetical protein